ncbi:MAG TPA: 50S ribosomal protein L22 [Sulfolobales archaeon]|nr:50S ribosomal protein L22 [Sulfolobales archaeon]
MPPRWTYPQIPGDRFARALGRELRISLKESIEIAKVIKGMKLDDAIAYLEKVVRKEAPVPYTRHRKQIAHRRGVNAHFQEWKTPVGRYPVKAARYILKVLRNVRSNAENQGMDPERLVIVHAAAHKGRYLKRYMPRAFGRATPWFSTTTNFEVVVKEVG